MYDENGTIRAKVIDFGFCCFGSTEDESVYVPRTEGWAAPELQDAFIKVREAKLADVFSYGKTCAWILLGQKLNLDNFLQQSLDLEDALNHETWDYSITTEQDMDFDKKIRGLLTIFFSQSFTAVPNLRTNNIEALLQSMRDLIETWEDL